MSESKVPVFTVIKNGSILKNIFIVNQYPDPKSQLSSIQDHILIVGRHPDCNIMLTHPSISRFHLQIRSNPSSQKLIVVDLSSVHGTWVSGVKVEAGMSVEMKEGDTLRIGASSRAYRLHWIPLSRAYDLENPFVTDLDMIVEEEKREEEEALLEEEEEEEEEEEKEMAKNASFCPADSEEVQSVDSIVEYFNRLFTDENLEFFGKKEIPSEDCISLYCDEKENCPTDVQPKENTTSGLFGTETSFLLTNSLIENKVSDTGLQVLSPPPVESAFECSNLNAISGVEVPEETNILSTLGEYLRESICLPVVEAVQVTKIQQKDVQQNAPFGAAVAAEMSQETGSGCTLIDNDREIDIITTGDENLTIENTFLPVEEATEETKFQPFEVALDLTSDCGKQIDCCQDHQSDFQQYKNSVPCHEQGLSMDEIVQDVEGKCNNNIPLIYLPAESTSAAIKSFLPVEEATQDTQFQTIDAALDTVSGSEICYEDHKSNFGPHQNSIPCNEQGHSIDRIVQDVEEKCNNNISLISLPDESSIISLSEESIMEILSDKENQTQKSPDAMVGLTEKKNLENGIESIETNSMCNNIWSRRGKATSAPQIQTSNSQIKNTANVDDDEVEMSYQKDTEEKMEANDLLSVALDIEEEEEIFTPDKENFSPHTLQLRFQKKKGKLSEIKHNKSRQRSPNSENHLSPEIYLGEISMSDKENQTLKVVRENKSARRPFGSYIKLEQNAKDMSNQKDISDKTVSKNLLAELDDEEEEYHTLDKENFSPHTLQLMSLEKKGKLDVEELTQSKSRKSHRSKAKFSSPHTTSGKENQSSKVTMHQKSKRRAFGNCIVLEQDQDQDALVQENSLERLPLQSLYSNSGGKSRPDTSPSVLAADNINAITYAQNLYMSYNPSHVTERSWNMIVDTASLLNKESRKALMLLQGLKGTHLIIPRIVIKELESMKGQFSFFRRISEASLALEWIEECMEKTDWWIHVQSSIEEGMLFAPTPPATPLTQLSEEGWSSYLSSLKSSMEILSPTAEDHIFDFALNYRRKQKDGQLVLLSEDDTLKIKSMAEGLACETVEEFRKSLVNPFSERFMWANSSPRGQTWSCQDDVVLREKYCRSPSRKLSSAKGLKLILLHNSRYGRLNSAR